LSYDFGTFSICFFGDPIVISKKCKSEIVIGSDEAGESRDPLEEIRERIKEGKSTAVAR